MSANSSAVGAESDPDLPDLWISGSGPASNYRRLNQRSSRCLTVIRPPTLIGAIATTVPVTCVVTAVRIVRRDPVRALTRWMRPSAVVPSIVRPLRSPVSLDPFIVWAGLGWHSVGARRGRWTDAHSDGHLRVRRRRETDQQCRECQYVEDSFHEENQCNQKATVWPPN